MDTPKTTGSMKPKSRDGKFFRLRSMDCFEEVHKRLTEGWPLVDIADFIQKECKEYTDITRDMMLKNLSAYRKTIPPHEITQKLIPRVANVHLKRLTKQIDEVEELEELVRFQKKRLKIDGDTERKIKKLLPTMTQEVRAQAEIIGRLANVKMDLGLATRHLGQINVDSTVAAEMGDRYGKASIAKVIQDPASRQKVLGLAEKFLSLAAIRQDNNIVDVTPAKGLLEHSTDDDNDGEDSK